MLRRIIIGVIFLTYFIGAQASEKKVEYVTYGLQTNGFEHALLAQALSYQSTKAVISRFPGRMPGVRAFSLMSEQRVIDIVWGSATRARFDTYLPIKVPIYKGLIGWRLALVKPVKQQIFADVNSLNDLLGFDLGQRYNWADYKIYKENGFTITSGANREALANMLVLNRFDFFPRAVIEIEKELVEFSDMDITLDPHLLIQYKSAFVFYVAKNNIALAKQLTDGLYKAKADGSFDRLFEHHFKSLFERLDLPNRRRITLQNSLLPQEMLEIDERFWIPPNS